MRAEIVERLLALNRRFYDEHAGSFAGSRDFFPPGFDRLSDHLPQPCRRLLDIGCGEGRLGRYLLLHNAVGQYVGVDFSARLLATARVKLEGEFWERDISRPGFLEGLGAFPAIACLSTLQHLPGRENRLQFMIEAATHLEPHGVFFLANWQFLDNVRQRRKIAAWPVVGIQAADVEETDYLLSWNRGGTGYRYVCLIDARETAALAQDAGLTVQEQYRSDGREGDLNLYTILRKQNADGP